MRTGTVIAPKRGLARSPWITATVAITPNPSSGTTNDLTKTFSYNAASQIVSETLSNDAYAFTGYTNGTQATATNGLNELATVDGVGATHDANGNLTYDPTTARTFAFDDENKVKSSTFGSVTATLSPDPLERLWQLSSSAGTDR